MSTKQRELFRRAPPPVAERKRPEVVEPFDFERAADETDWTERPVPPELRIPLIDGED